MMGYRRLFALSLMGLGAAASACASILGDNFTISGSVPGGPADGAADTASDGAPHVDSPGPGDGPTQDGPTPQKYACDTWSLTTPLRIDSLSNEPASSSRNYDRLFAKPAGKGQLLVVTRSNNANEEYRIFKVSTDHPQPNMPSWRSGGPGRVLDVQRITGGVGVLSSIQSATGGGMSFHITVVPDSVNNGSVQLVATPVSAIMSGVSWADSGRFFETSPGHYLYVVSYNLGPAQGEVIASGVSDSNAVPQVILSGADATQNLQSSWLFPYLDHAYFTTGSDGPGIVTEYELSLTTAQPTGRKRTLGDSNLQIATLGTAFAGGVDVGPADHFDMVLARIQQSGLSLSIGQVAGTDVMTFPPQTFGHSFASDPSQLPVSAGSAAWGTDELVMIGQGIDPATFKPLPGTGLNLFWVDVNGVVRAQATAPKQIYPNLANAPVQTAIAFGPSFVGLHQGFEVVWTEQAPNTSGSPYENLYFNEMVCHP